MVSHWFCDFVLQTDEQAKGKSTSITALMDHTIMYSYVMFGILLSYMGYTYGTGDPEILRDCVAFGGITLVAHSVTDYFTSKLNKYLWEKKDVHNFFVSIGFDQILHYAQLFITYKLLFNG